MQRYRPLWLFEAPDDKKELKTFKDMRNWNTFEKESDGRAWVTCNDMEFGLAEKSKHRMQCYCEPTKKIVPTTCADDGGDCLCNGLVYYMKKQAGDINKPTDFYTGMRGAYTVNQANN